MAKSKKAAASPKSPDAIRVLRPPKNAFNKARPVSDLLWTQVEHLAAVVRRTIDDRRRAVNTEGEASAFIAKMTDILNSLNAEDR
jgi:hypothetical protein